MKIVLTEPLYLLLLLSVPAAAILLRLFVRTPGRRAVLSLIMRSTIFLLLALGLSRVSTASDADRVNAMFLLDVSDSLNDLTRRAALEGFRSSLEGMGEADTAGLVLFGANASVEISPRADVEETAVESDVDGKATDIARAIQVALANLPDAGSSRIVLLSDGNETRGSALQAARASASAGVEIFTVALFPGIGENELLVKDVIVPTETRSGQVFDFTVLVESLAAAHASLLLSSDGEYVGEDTLDLAPGENGVSYRASFDTPGLHRIEVVLTSADDGIEENNRYEVFLRTTGPPSIMYASQRGKSTPPLVAALRTQGFDVSVIGTDQIPGRVSDFAEYDAVILDNVPGFDLSVSRMELMETYVRDAGGGLLMIGGDRSFGLGGYYGTPVERILPVDMDASSSADVPTLTLLMIVDKSGSMSGFTAGGQTKLDLVKSAALSAVELLNPYHRAGVLAFDADVEWSVPLTDAGRRQEIVDGLAGLAPGGGTDIFGALQAGLEAVKESPSAVKHLLLLSDGLTDRGDFEALAAEAFERSVTISTVAVGGDADRALMADLARWGRGRYYYTDDVEEVPRIFASEAVIASQGLLREEPFVPQPGVPHEILQGIEDLPILEGFVLTYPKPTAREVLRTPDGKPLLAVHGYGLGKAAAFTSSFRGDWGSYWAEWTTFPRFAAQLVRWIHRPAAGEELQVTLREENGRGAILVDAENENFINFLDLKASVIYPNGSASEAAVRQTGPGEYQGGFDAGENGAYIITLHDTGARIPPQVHGLIVPYSREHRRFEPNLGLLESVAEITGGRTIPLEVLGRDRLFAAGAADWTVERDLGIWLIPAAAILLLLEVAARKLTFPGKFFRRLAQRRGSGRPGYDELARAVAERRRAERQERVRRDLGFWYGRRDLPPPGPAKPRRKRGDSSRGRKKTV